MRAGLAAAASFVQGLLDGWNSGGGGGRAAACYEVRLVSAAASAAVIHAA